MKMLSVLFLLACILFLSCGKDQAGAEKVCYKGRYVGDGCWSIIQVLEPFNLPVAGTQWQNKDSTYRNVFGTGEIPEKYKDGKPFYFIIDSIAADPFHTMHCNTAGYVAAINSYSDSNCEADH